MTSTFSYIIPFYNSKDSIKDTLDSVIKNDNVLEVILVDDCSEDGTLDLVAGYAQNHSHVKYIRNKSRLGAGLSRNAGACMAKGDILVFLDSDIVIPPDSGRIIEDYFLGSRINPRPDAIVANRAREALCNGLVGKYKNYWTSFNFSKLKGWTPFLCASLFAVRKGAFMSVNGFRKISFSEDGDLGYRLSMSSYKIYFAGDLIARHNKNFTISSLLKREFRAGRDGIKVKISNRDFNDVIKDKKFFAVNKNFVYSFPFAIIFNFSGILGIMFLNWAFLSIAALSMLGIISFNREFLDYASCGRNPAKGIFYVFLMIAQLNVIGLGILSGLFDIAAERLSKAVSLVKSYSGSLFKLFIKSRLRPEQVTFFVTNQCNLDCKHCFLNRGEATHGGELTTAEICSISEKMDKVNFVTITGGEPFIRNDIAEIVRILSKNLKPSLVTILTNGYATDTVVYKINEILQDCPRQDILVKISLDGFAEVHDKMRSKPGSFDNARATFIRLRGLKKIYKNLSLGIITTYTHQNKDYIESFYDEVITDLMPDQYGLIMERFSKANKLDENIKIDDYIKVLNRINIKMLPSAKGFFRKFRLIYKMRMAEKLREIYLTRKYPMRCFAGILNAVIGPGGDVFVCEQFNYRIGNLREKRYDWNAVWRSDQAEKARGLIRKKTCFCTNECYMPFNLCYDIKELSGLLIGTMAKGRIQA